MKKLLPFLALFLAGCATYSSPALLNQYETLGYHVYKYGDNKDFISGNYRNVWWEIIDEEGYRVAVTNWLGFMEWKKSELLRLIENPHTDHAKRESYKLQYQTTNDEINKMQNFAVLSSMMPRKSILKS